MTDALVKSDLNSLLPPEMLENLLDEIQEANTSSSMVYGKGPQFDEIRYLDSKAWLDSGFFSWSLPGQREYEEELSGEVKGKVTKLIGYIAHAAIGASPKKWDESTESYIPACQMIGMKQKGEYVSGLLPSNTPLKNMYAWDNSYEATDREGNTYKGGYNPNKPDPLVTKLGLFGSKNGLCSECIKRGDNILKKDGEPYVDPNYGKNVYCDINNSYIIFAVTAIETTTVKVNKQDPKAKPETITNQYDIGTAIDEEDCPFILVKINLSKKSGLSGIWNRAEKRREVQGYATLCAELARTKDAEIESNPIRRIINFNEIIISIEPRSPKNFLDFQAFTPNIELLKQIQLQVKEAESRAERIIIPKSDLEPEGETSLVGNSANDLPNLKSVTIIEDEVEDENPFA